MYGDDWLIRENKKNKKQNFAIENQTIHHLGSISSSNATLSPICKNDKKIYKKLTIKWHHRLFSIEKNWDCTKIRILGLTLKTK
jgi:hypothetical protein